MIHIKSWCPLIDIHTHILPDVDDGARNFEESLKMIKESIKQGINHIVVTPHIFSPYIKCKTKNEIIKVFDEFTKNVKDAGLNVNLYLGHEVSYHIRIFDYFKHGEFLTLNNKNIILLELPYDRELETFEDLQYNFECYGQSLILAHIERYDYYSIRKLKHLKSNNVYFQINASSLMKSHRYFKKANKLLKAGLVDFIASDIHYNRINHMQEAYEFVTKNYGQDVATKIFYDNPSQLIL